MTKIEPIKREIRPKLVQRPAGGWMAFSPVNSGISIGVDGATKAEAVERFRSRFLRWLEILALNEQKVLDVPK